MRLKVGVPFIDDFLKDCFNSGEITTLYGPAATGKTLLCLMLAKSASKIGKVIYVDSEMEFPIERFKQIDDDWEEDLKNIFILKPKSFSEQKKIVFSLKPKKVSAVIIDSITKYYATEDYPLKDLERQLLVMKKVARENNIPIIITSRVFTNPDKKTTHTYGENVIRLYSKRLIGLMRVKKGIKMEYKGKNVFFRIAEKGIIPL